jgi:hypothetical protein
MFELKPLSLDAIPAALAKAERYRLLNEPDQAESICEDILAREPGHHEARVMLLLALTDRFPQADGPLVSRARALAAQLDTPYERAYFGGLVAERRARALLSSGGPSRLLNAADWLRDAMRLYELAEAEKPVGNDDARLRWNACARTLNAHPELLQAADEPALPLMLE